MTTEELKKKIDGIFLGLHSTNPGDINAIKDILNALVDTAAEAPTVGKLLSTNTDLSTLFNAETTPTLDDFVTALGTDVNRLCAALEKDVTTITDENYQLTAVLKYLNHYQDKLRGATVVFGAKYNNNYDIGVMCYLSFDLIDEDYAVDYYEI